MVFSSPIFVFFFLPLTLAGFFVVPKPMRTPFLVAASLLFYTWGEKEIVLLLALSIVLNWAIALAMERVQRPGRRRLLLFAAVALNIGALLYFKYTNFVVGNLSLVLQHFGRRPLHVAPVHLPIGVSFVTFEALSYVIDVYRGDTRAARNPLHVAFYVSFFPHLIAGPILRFRDISSDVAQPQPNAAQFESGVSRFIIGLAKKMLVANPLGTVADTIFGLGDQVGPSAAWLGVVAYALQIYFDFSGYSDMAIGLGRLVGFSLPENFRLPYAAQSIKDFWRRWHISLSSWFRDYLFIPLGGSRASRARTYLNLLIVFTLCGLWHGASWTFVLWGLFHGSFLVIERVGLGDLLERTWRPIRHAYTMLVVLVGWVFFRADSFAHATSYLKAMAGFAKQGPALSQYLTIRVELALVIGALAATLPLRAALDRLEPGRDDAWRVGWRTAGAAGELLLLLISSLFLAAETYNPFIYFRF